MRLMIVSLRPSNTLTATRNKNISLPSGQISITLDQYKGHPTEQKIAWQTCACTHMSVATRTISMIGGTRSHSVPQSSTYIPPTTCGGYLAIPATKVASGWGPSYWSQGAPFHLANRLWSSGMNGPSRSYMCSGSCTETHERSDHPLLPCQATVNTHVHNVSTHVYDTNTNMHGVNLSGVANGKSAKAAVPR